MKQSHMGPIVILLLLLTLSAAPSYAECKVKDEWFLFFPHDTLRIYNANGVHQETYQVEKHFDWTWGKWAIVYDVVNGSSRVRFSQDAYFKLTAACQINGNSISDWAAVTAYAGLAVDAGELGTASREFDVGDVNGDGVADVVSTASFNPPGASVRISNPDETFRPPVRYASGAGPEAVLLADLNGDTVFDLIVANAGNFNNDSGSVSVLLGNADGTFRAAVNYVAGVAPNALAVGDFNKDGKLDLAVANGGPFGAPALPPGNGNVSVLLGNGDGTLGAPVQLVAGNRPFSILAADFNKDGNLDLAVANDQGGTVSLLLGNGNGTFQNATQTAVGARPSFLGAADLNGDGKLDLVVLHSSTATLSVWRGSGDGAFQSHGRYVTGVRIRSFTLVTHVDDDRPTILTPDAAAGRLLVFGVNLDGTLVAPRAYPVGAGARWLSAADFNGDNRTDVVVADGGGIKLLRGTGTGVMEAPQVIAIPGAPGSASLLTSGDYNGDGRADVVVRNSNGRLSVLIGNGSGGFQAGSVLVIGNNAEYLASVDVNADGKLDLAVVERGPSDGKGSLAVFLGNGDGTFQAAANYATGNFSGNLTSGDFNGDGRADIAVVNKGIATLTRGGISLFLSNANGTLQPAINIDAGESPDYAAAADFNGDGRLDLAFVGIATTSPNYIFRVTVLRGNGNGTFQAPLHHVTNLQSGFMVAQDFDADGRQDLMVSLCCGTTDMMQLLGNGDGTFRESHFPGGADPLMFASADFNADGRPDMAVMNDGGGAPQVGILMNTLSPMAIVSAAGNVAGNVLAADSIVSAYGYGLANATAATPTPAWPMELGGTTVHVRSAKGPERQAQIAYASPGQVNFVIPAETEPGLVTVKVTSGDGKVTVGETRVRRASPGVFTAGPVLAAAQIVRVRPSGELVFEPVLQVDGAGQLVAAPIDLGAGTEQVTLLLYGTGIRNRLSLGQVRVTIGGVEAIVQYAGSQGEFPGLDQINVVLPQSLRGRGLVDVVLTLEGLEANTVRIHVL